jgi:hypothetical protein
MDKNKSLMFLLIIYLVISICLTDLTGLHYLSKINCSSSKIYIPQGPYLFSHHWPFTSITVQYHRQITTGTCYRDGSLYFILNNNKFCIGNYNNGQAKLFCRFEKDEYCFINMTTSDESQLTCDVWI